MVIDSNVYALAFSAIGASEPAENIMRRFVACSSKDRAPEIHHELARLTWLRSLPPELKPSKTASAVTVPLFTHTRRKFRPELNTIVKGFFKQADYMDGISNARDITANSGYGVYP
jgi:hypothetical protein